MAKRTNRYIRCGDYYKIELYRPYSSKVCGVALISKDDVEIAKKIFWRKTEYGYARGYNPETKKDILLHKYITQTTSETIIDHINRNKLDCRRENMRIATSQINSLNRNAPANSNTGYKGVSLDKRSGKYRAYAKVDRKQVCLGYFETIEMAYQARQNFERPLMNIVTMNCQGV